MYISTTDNANFRIQSYTDMRCNWTALQIGHAHPFRATSERSGAHMYHLFTDEIVENESASRVTGWPHWHSALYVGWNISLCSSEWYGKLRKHIISTDRHYQNFHWWIVFSTAVHDHTEGFHIRCSMHFILITKLKYLGPHWTTASTEIFNLFILSWERDKSLPYYLYVAIINLYFKNHFFKYWFGTHGLVPFFVWWDISGSVPCLDAAKEYAGPDYLTDWLWKSGDW